MSDNIYDDVISIGSQGTERVEMMVDIYESVDCVNYQGFRTNKPQPLQQTGSDSKRIRSSRATVCLGLLCVFQMIAIVLFCFYIYSNKTNNTQEMSQFLTNITNLTEEKSKILNKITNLTEEKSKMLNKITNLTEEKSKILNKITNLTEEKNKMLNKITNLTEEKSKMLNKITNLTEERNKILTNITNLTKERDQLQEKNKDEWFYYQSSFYFISSEEKSWSESRRYCSDRGADLIIVNNSEEQDILNKLSGRIAVWIGLTGSGKNRSWTWIDGTNMTTALWSHGEPNEAGGEICAVSHSSEWSDYKCHYSFQWICEKSSLKCH
ncbi:uncharacterized protein [Danio rerio]|uniref:Uncharacterized protein n=1 Tax=Danio rerio TaxID=7955 RepID=A0A8M9QHF1_DANRE